MTRNEIISELYTSKDFNDCINKMEPEHLRNDLRNEVALVLLEKSDDTILGLAERGELKWYVVRVILNMCKSNTSQFVKKYRDNKIVEQEFNNEQRQSELSLFFYKKLKIDIENIPVHELNGRYVKELKQEACLRYINTELYWYDKEIVLLYMKHGSFRAIEKETRIPWESTYGTIRRVINKIREEVLNVTE